MESDTRLQDMASSLIPMYSSLDEWIYRFTQFASSWKILLGIQDVKDGA